MRIRIDKYEPIAGCGRSAGVAGARDLIQRFENDFRSGGASDFAGFIRGIIVANDEFGLPAAFVEGGEGVIDVTKCLAEPPLFIEGRDNRRNFQLSTSSAASRIQAAFGPPQNASLI